MSGRDDDWNQGWRDCSETVAASICDLITDQVALAAERDSLRTELAAAREALTAARVDLRQALDLVVIHDQDWSESHMRALNALEAAEDARAALTPRAE